MITEDWCGDALYNLPVLAKMVEGAPNVEMRVFLRDRNPELMKYAEYEEIAFTYQKITWTWIEGGITAEDDWETPVV